ncbi:hypothetical protein HDV04_002473 [Boothiomyces sp. JEL0838]|nr:hypothetical protein HDV04_002473 [Boothiomyces sp. JEL0838]
MVKAKAEKEAPVATRSSSRLQGKTVEEPVAKKVKKAPVKKVKEEAVMDAEEEAPEEKPSKHLKIGDHIPSIELETEDGETVDLLEVAKESGVVVFFYPKASTPGCTTQGCTYRDHHASFADLGYKVYGCSADSVKSQLNFKTKQNFNYSLFSDPKFKLIGAIGAKAPGNKVTRSRLVIEKGGKILDIQIKVSPKSDTTDALEFIKGL